MKQRVKLFVLSFFVVLLLSGCSVIKARPAKDAGFVPHPELLAERRERAPFHGYWVRDADQYDQVRFTRAKVFIAPIDVEHAVKLYQESGASEKSVKQRAEEAEELARYFREKLRLVLESYKDGRVKVDDEAERDALALRLALVEIVPTNPGVNILGTAAGFFVPGGGLIKVLGEGSVAMEGVVDSVESQEGESGTAPQGSTEALPVVWESFKDREGQKTSPFSVKDYQEYAHIRVALDEWAMQIAQLLNTPHSVQVEDGDLVSVNPL